MVDKKIVYVLYGLRPLLNSNYSERLEQDFLSRMLHFFSLDSKGHAHIKREREREKERLEFPKRGEERTETESRAWAMVI